MFNENRFFFKSLEEIFEVKITIQNIEDFEIKYNLKLPNDYKEFLIKFGGYRTNDSLVFKTNFDIFGNISYLEFFTLKQIESFIENIINNEYDDIGQDLIKNKIICIGYSISNGLPIGMSLITNKIGIIDYGIRLDTSFFIISNSFYEFINNFFEKKFEEN